MKRQALISDNNIKDKCKWINLKDTAAISAKKDNFSLPCWYLIPLKMGATIK